MSAFYQQFLSDKSFSVLLELKKRYKFVLIGGWAVYFYTNALKSKDVDIVINYGELEKIKKDFPLEKNERLKKYQFKLEEIDVDVYLPFYSDLGIALKEIIEKTAIVNGFTLPEKEILLITKLKAYQGRRTSVKGQKDLIDIVSLVLLSEFDFKHFLNLVNKYKLKESLKNLRDLLMKTKEIEELNLNQHSFAKKKREILKRLT